TGQAKIIIGTHAVFQETVRFDDLGLVVIDEQHRFGVNQRFALTQKGRTVDHLLMTATPIPRSLVLSLYGDIATSKLTQKPKGRQIIKTRAMPVERIEALLSALAEALRRDERVFWICPLVEASDKIDLQAAEARFQELQTLFGDRVGLVHGRMRAEAKAQAMQAFAQGETRILVATTVVEVGIDVPEATIMIIEHAERFGLAQLHQLRGRVGRGAQASSCILLYAAPLSATAKARLKILRETDDGFRIAEEDLRLRGPGEVLGTRQSGMPIFRFADLAAHEPLIERARDTAAIMLAAPDICAERINLLLHLFERHDAIDRLAAG
ncbi:MAG: helicase-related protein, partial [Pseudomonadota bacterium]